MTAWTGTPATHRGGIPEALAQTIQSHGFLLGVHAEFGTVEVASTNLADFAGVDHADALGQKLSDVLHPAIAAVLARIDDTPGTGPHVRAVRLPPPHPSRVDPGGGTARAAPAPAPAHAVGRPVTWATYDVLLHRSGHLWILEFEPAPAEPVRLRDVYEALRRVTDHAGPPDAVIDRCAAVAREVRVLTGADRARVYRFAADPGRGGTVVAEDCRPDVPSSTGLACAGDAVPAHQRDRYQRLLLRSVADVDDRPVALVCSPGSVTGPGVDPVSLRSESTASLERLRGHGVGGVLTVPLVVDGRLWGLLSCSHRAPLRTSHDLRSACVLLGQLLAREVHTAVTADDRRASLRRRRLAREVVSAMSVASSPVDGALDARGALLAMVDADGVVVEFGGARVTAGDVGAPGDVDDLLDRAARLAPADGQVWATDDIHRDAPDTPDTPDGRDGRDRGPTGVLVVRPGPGRTDRVLWRRCSDSGTAAATRPWSAGELATAVDVAAALADLQGLRTRLGLAEQEITALADRLAAATAHGVREEELHQNRRLESLGQLAGGVAHDVNNLLAVIGASAEFAAEEVLAEARSTGGERWTTVSADIEQIQLATRHAGELTHQLLAFARSEPGRPVAVDLNAAITSLAQLLRRTLGDGVELVADLAPDLPPFLADPGQVEQVLVNLAVNARDAMPRGGRLVLATARVDGGRSVRLRVTDTGTGMTRAVLDRVFEPFFTTKQAGRGTGLGLATVHGVVTQLGGTIAVGSLPGQGTTFTLAFPATAAAPTRSPIDDAPGRRGATVLVVDDREELRNLTTRVLRDAGYEVLTATDGPSALAVARGCRPRRVDLLLSDLQMPRMGGDELAARLTADHHGLRVLFMSGYDAPSTDVDRSPRYPVVNKPFTRAALLAAVAGALDPPDVPDTPEVGGA